MNPAYWGECDKFVENHPNTTDHIVPLFLCSFKYYNLIHDYVMTPIAHDAEQFFLLTLTLVLNSSYRTNLFTPLPFPGHTITHSLSSTSLFPSEHLPSGCGCLGYIWHNVGSDPVQWYRKILRRKRCLMWFYWPLVPESHCPILYDHHKDIVPGKN